MIITKRRIVTTLIPLAVVFLLAVFTGCAPRQAAENPPSGESSTEASTGSGESTLQVAAWSYDTECSSCHANHDGTTAFAVQHAGFECKNCHSDEKALQGVHADPTKLPTIAKLRKTKIDNSYCLSCHTSKEELATKTANLTILTDENGTLENPHQLPDTEKHNQNIHCGSCHNMHNGTPPEEQAPELCLSCHHMNVYMGCVECHEDGVG
jgi:hypothetical protein